MRTLRFEFSTNQGFLYNTRETLPEARLCAIGLANDLHSPVTIHRVYVDALGHTRYKTEWRYNPTNPTKYQQGGH